MGDQEIVNEPCYIYHTRRYKENGLLLSIFSLNYGRLTVIASNLHGDDGYDSSVLEPFVPLKLHLNKGREELYFLYEIEQANEAYKFDLPYYYCATYLNELLYYLFREQSPSKMLFGRYVQALEAISTKSTPIIERALRIFENTLIEHLGYAISYYDSEGEQIKKESSYRFNYGLGFVEITPKLRELLSRINPLEYGAPPKDNFDSKLKFPKVKPRPQTFSQSHSHAQQGNAIQGNPDEGSSQSGALQSIDAANNRTDDNIVLKFDKSKVRGRSIADSSYSSSSRTGLGYGANSYMGARSNLNQSDFNLSASNELNDFVGPELTGYDILDIISGEFKLSTSNQLGKQLNNAILKRLLGHNKITSREQYANYVRSQKQALQEELGSSQHLSNNVGENQAPANSDSQNLNTQGVNNIGSSSSNDLDQVDGNEQASVDMKGTVGASINASGTSDNIAQTIKAQELTPWAAAAAKETGDLKTYEAFHEEAIRIKGKTLHASVSQDNVPQFDPYQNGPQNNHQMAPNYAGSLNEGPMYQNAYEPNKLGNNHFDEVNPYHTYGDAPHYAIQTTMNRRGSMGSQYETEARDWNKSRPYSSSGDVAGFTYNADFFANSNGNNINNTNTKSSSHELSVNSSIDYVNDNKLSYNDGFVKTSDEYKDSNTSVYPSQSEHKESLNESDEVGFNKHKKDAFNPSIAQNAAPNSISNSSIQQGDVYNANANTTSSNGNQRDKKDEDLAINSSLEQDNSPYSSDDFKQIQGLSVRDRIKALSQLISSKNETGITASQFLSADDLIKKRENQKIEVSDIDSPISDDEGLPFNRLNHQEQVSHNNDNSDFVDHDEVVSSIEVLANNGPSHAAEHTSEHAAEHVSEHAGERASEHVSEHAAEHAAEHVSEHAAEHVSEHAAEHASEHADAANAVSNAPSYEQNEDSSIIKKPEELLRHNDDDMSEAGPAAYVETRKVNEVSHSIASTMSWIDDVYSDENYSDDSASEQYDIDYEDQNSKKIAEKSDFLDPISDEPHADLGAAIEADVENTDETAKADETAQADISSKIDSPTADNAELANDDEVNAKESYIAEVSQDDKSKDESFDTSLDSVALATSKNVEKLHVSKTNADATVVDTFDNSTKEPSTKQTNDETCEDSAALSHANISSDLADENAFAGDIECVKPSTKKRAASSLKNNAKANSKSQVNTKAQTDNKGQVNKIAQNETKANVKANVTANAKAQALKDREKAKVKAALVKEREKAKAKMAREREKAKAKASLEKEREKAKAKAALEKEREKAKAKAALEKEREKAKVKAEKEREKAKAKAAMQKQREKEKAKAKAIAEKERAKAKAQREREKAEAKAQAEALKAMQKQSFGFLDLIESKPRKRRG